MGLYDDDDVAVTEGSVDDENFYLARVHAKWLDAALKMRMKEDGVKYVLNKILEYVGSAEAKFPAHKELAEIKAKATKIMGKLDEKTQAWSGNIKAATPGWHQEVWRKGWADGEYALYLKENNRTAEAKTRAENAVWRIKDGWMKDEEAIVHACYPKAELEELVGKVAPIGK